MFWFSFNHSVSAPLLYALRESLAEIVAEGLDLFRLRHAENAQRLREGLQNIGLELYVENPEQRSPSITSVRIPHGVKIENVIKCMMDRYGLNPTYNMLIIHFSGFKSQLSAIFFVCL